MFPQKTVSKHLNIDRQVTLTNDSSFQDSSYRAFKHDTITNVPKQGHVSVPLNIFQSKICLLLL